jgi:hypothetical protein
LTCRNIFTLNEVNYEALFRIGLELNVPVVKTYDLNKGNMGAILGHLRVCHGQKKVMW